jgi:bacterioferritin
MPGNDRRNAGKKSRGRWPWPASDPCRGPCPQPHASIAGDPVTISFLNKVLKNELTAINQYFLHSRMLADWGLSILAHKEYEESIDEMKHADKLIKRVLFLGGLPNLQDLGKLFDRGKRAGSPQMRPVAGDDRPCPISSSPSAHCETVKDYISRELFTDILESEEEHIDWLQTQMRLIEQMGSRTSSSSRPSPTRAVPERGSFARSEFVAPSLMYVLYTSLGALLTSQNPSRSAVSSRGSFVCPLTFMRRRRHNRSFTAWNFAPNPQIRRFPHMRLSTCRDKASVPLQPAESPR